MHALNADALRMATHGLQTRAVTPTVQVIGEDLGRFKRLRGVKTFKGSEPGFDA
jgi:hypothetical protein